MAALLILVLVFVFDLIAFALALAAEHRRNTAHISQDANSSFCVYDKDIATGLGVGSLLFLMLSQVIVMAATRCLCFGRALKSSLSKGWAITLFITCWGCFAIAELFLLAGSVTNARHTKYVVALADDPPSCAMVRKGVFAVSAALIALTGIASGLYYELYSRAYDNQRSFNTDFGIRMGTL